MTKKTESEPTKTNTEKKIKVGKRETCRHTCRQHDIDKCNDCGRRTGKKDGTEAEIGYDMLMSGFHEQAERKEKRENRKQRKTKK